MYKIKLDNNFNFQYEFDINDLVNETLGIASLMGYDVEIESDDYVSNEQIVINLQIDSGVRYFIVSFYIAKESLQIGHAELYLYENKGIKRIKYTNGLKGLFDFIKIDL